MGELSRTSGVVDFIFEHTKQTNSDNLLDGCLEILKQKNWDIKWYQKNNRWYLLNKIEIVYEFQQWAELESFIYGLSFSAVRANHGPWENVDTQVRNNIGSLQDLTNEIKLERLLELVKEINELNKALLQFCRSYKTNSNSVYYLYTHDMLEVYHQGEADIKADLVKWINLYESWSNASLELLKLTNEDVIYFQNHLKARRFIQINLKQSLPILLAFLDRLFAGTPWWLINSDPQVDEEQGKTEFGEWFFYMGSNLIFTGYTEGEFVGFLFGIAVGSKELPIRSVP